MEIAKEIIIAMFQNGYIYKCNTSEENIEIVKKAYKEIYDQLRER